MKTLSVPNLRAKPQVGEIEKL